MSKHTRLVIIALFTLAIIFLLNSSVDAKSVVVGESTEAVERTDIIREKSDILIDQATVLPVKELRKDSFYEGDENKLFFGAEDYDIASIIEELKNPDGITSSNKYYKDMEEMANGGLHLYLGIYIRRDSYATGKVELITSSGVDLLKGDSGFDFVENLPDHDHNIYLEIAFKSADAWMPGASLDFINDTLTLKDYYQEDDKEPRVSSEIILVPKDDTDKNIQELKYYVLTRDNKIEETEFADAQDTKTYAAIFRLKEDEAKKFSYNSKTDTVTMNGLVTTATNAMVSINAKNLHVIGNNKFYGEFSLSQPTTTITMNPEAILDSKIYLTAYESNKTMKLVEVEKSEYYVENIDLLNYEGSLDGRYSIDTYTVLKSTRPNCNDVNPNDWYYTAIKYTYQNGIISGATDTEFRPSAKITRGMIVTILWRMEGSPKVTGVKDFTDVKGQYYYDAVRWAAKKGIVNGYGDGRFGPNANITREQLATILCNYAKYKKKYTSSTVNTSKYKDWNRVSSYARASMQWAIAKGVITGKENGTRVDPLGTASRGEAAVMIYNYCTKIKN